MNWILDADIKGFFDHVSHEWLEKFVKHRIADTRILRLIQKWLKAGVLEDGEWSETKVGYSARGGDFAAAGQRVPALRIRSMGGSLAQESGQGRVIVVRYADDLVVGFEHRAEAERFLKEFQERLAKFGLEVHAGEDAADRVWAR